VKVAERLARLFADSRRPDGQLWTITYLTDELNARGHEVSRQYLGHLLTGARDNPNLSLLEGLADVFGVPVSYFSEDYLGRVTNDLLPLLAAVQDPNVRALLHRPDLADIAAVLANTDQVTATPELTELLARADLQDVAEDLTQREFLTWLGDRRLAEVLATLRAPVVQSVVEETLANWLRYGSGR
jgi:transcriptional regulator with XRE-family HTH domain